MLFFLRINNIVNNVVAEQQRGFTVRVYLRDCIACDFSLNNFRKINVENNVKLIHVFRGFIGIALVIMSKLKHQFDLLCSIVPSTSQQSSGTLCLKLNREPLYSQYPPTKLLLHSLTQLKPHSNTQILQTY